MKKFMLLICLVSNLSFGAVVRFVNKSSKTITVGIEYGEWGKAQDSKTDKVASKDSTSLNSWFNPINKLFWIIDGKKHSRDVIIPTTSISNTLEIYDTYTLFNGSQTNF